MLQSVLLRVPASPRPRVWSRVSRGSLALAPGVVDPADRGAEPEIGEAADEADPTEQVVDRPDLGVEQPDPEDRRGGDGRQRRQEEDGPEDRGPAQAAVEQDRQAERGQDPERDDERGEVGGPGDRAIEEA